MNPIHVLLVEDNPADADLTREGFAAGVLPFTKLGLRNNSTNGLHRLARPPAVSPPSIV